MNKCAVDGLAAMGIRRRVRVQLLQSAGQGVRIAGEVRACRIGLIFAGTRHGELNQACGDRRDDQHEESPEASASPLFAVVIAISAEESWPSVPCSRAW